MSPRTMTMARMRRAAALTTALAGILMLTGCDPRPLFYFLQPFEPTIPAPGPSLKGKKVVVLTHVTSNAQAQFPGLDRDINRQFVNGLKKNKKTTVVAPEKVATWVEGHPNWTDPSDCARDFEADYAIFLEVEDFRVQEPGDLNVLQGSAKVHIQAYELAFPTNSKGKPIKDQEKESQVKYDDYQETTFPVRGPVPMDSGIGQVAFKNKLIQVVGNECSWHFVEHAQEDVVQDVRFGQR